MGEDGQECEACNSRKIVQYIFSRPSAICAQRCQNSPPDHPVPFPPDKHDIRSPPWVLNTLRSASEMPTFPLFPSLDNSLAESRKHANAIAMYKERLCADKINAEHDR